MPAEIVRERDGVSGDAPRPLAPVNDAARALAAPIPTSGVDLGPLAARAFVTGPERQASMIEQKGAAMKPAIEATRSALAAPMPSDENVRAAERRVVDVAAQQPSRGFRAFLSPVEGEDPLASIQKLVQAVGLFAGGIGIRGSAAGAARGSVAALTGALAGWNQGDKERGDRMFQDWKAKSQAALTAWELESAAYTRALTQRGLTLEERAREIALIAAEHDNPIAAEQIRAQGVMGFLDWVTKREDIAAKYEQARAQLLASHEARLIQLRTAEERNAEMARHNKEMERLARERADDKRDAAERGKTLPAGEVDKIAETRQFISQLKRAGELFKPEYAGPVTQWTRWAKGMTSGLPADETEFRSLVSNFENTLLKLRSGAAVTQQEFDRIKRELPQFGDPPKTFPIKLRVAREALENVLSAKEQTFRAAGYFVPDLAPFERGASGKIVIIAPDGVEGYWDASKPLPSGYRKK